MRKRDKPKDDLKPYLGIIIIILTLFMVVFAKMEVRRLGYVLYKKSKLQKKALDNYYLKKIEYARVTRPDYLRYIALTQLSLNEAQKGQIIQLSGDRIVVPQ